MLNRHKHARAHTHTHTFSITVVGMWKSSLCGIRLVKSTNRVYMTSHVTKTEPLTAMCSDVKTSPPETSSHLPPSSPPPPPSSLQEANNASLWVSEIFLFLFSHFFYSFYLIYNMWKAVKTSKDEQNYSSSVEGGLGKRLGAVCWMNKQHFQSAQKICQNIVNVFKLEGFCCGITVWIWVYCLCEWEPLSFGLFQLGFSQLALAHTHSSQFREMDFEWLSGISDCWHNVLHSSIFKANY